MTKIDPNRNETLKKNSTFSQFPANPRAPEATPYAARTAGDNLLSRLVVFLIAF